MNDVFVEQLIERKQTWKNILLKLGIVFLALIISAIFLIIGSLRMVFPFVFAASLWGAYQLIQTRNIEYEYSFTNGEMDVDEIRGRRKRKRLLSVNFRKIELMAPLNEATRKDYLSAKNGKILDVSTSVRAENRWFVKFDDEGGGRTILIFEPNARLVGAIKTVNPRKVLEGKS